MAYNSSKELITDNLSFWQSILNEENEKQLVLQTGDISIGLSSKRPDIVSFAHTMINGDKPLPTNVIDELIARKESHLLVGTSRYEQVLSRIKSTQQMHDFIDSLKANHKEKELSQFLASYFCIPPALSKDPKTIIEICENAIMK